jgi:hypothetical protein
MIMRVQTWVREIAGLAPDAAVEVREEAHCPDPSCPLRRTVLLWRDTAGKTHRTYLVKPLAYVRQPDVERALRLYAAAG